MPAHVLAAILPLTCLASTGGEADPFLLTLPSESATTTSFLEEAARSPLNLELRSSQPGGAAPAPETAANPAADSTGKLPMHIFRGGPDTSMYKRPAWTILPYVSYELQTRSGLTGDNGSIQVDRIGAGGNLIFGPEQDLQISIIFDYERSDYHFRGPRVSPGGTPLFDDAEAWDVIPNFELRMGPDWGLFGGAILAWAGEDGADFGDSARYGGFGGVRWLFSDKLNFALGLTVVSRLEDDPSVFPIIGIEWAFADRWRLLTEGSGVKLEFDPVDFLILRLQAAYNTREYRLADTNAGLPNGVFSDTSVPHPLWRRLCPPSVLLPQDLRGLHRLPAAPARQLRRRPLRAPPSHARSPLRCEHRTAVLNLPVSDPVPLPRAQRDPPIGAAATATATHLGVQCGP